MKNRTVVYFILLASFLQWSCKRSPSGLTNSGQEKAAGHIDVMSSNGNNNGSLVSDSDRTQFKTLHGLDLPRHSISCRTWHERKEYAFSVVLIEKVALDQVIKQLKLKERHGPLSPGSSDPNLLGYGVWPHLKGSYVPSGIRGEGEHFFDGMAIPIEMFSCESQTGDWLHVDVWQTNDGRYFMRLYTSYS